ncbi:hypothetical protein [Simkania sp.]|uniref:hypothetical protein n=1 Tax=Simkania sp. TaxID=34094 RepID=UPI003B51A105
MTTNLRLDGSSSQATPSTETAQTSKSSSRIKQIALASMCFAGLATLTISVAYLLTPERVDQPLAEYDAQQAGNASCFGNLGALAVAGIQCLVRQRELDTPTVNETNLTSEPLIIDESNFSQPEEEKPTIQYVETSGFTDDQAEKYVKSLEETLETSGMDELEQVSEGLSKQIYTHPKLPGVVIKRSTRKFEYSLIHYHFLSGKQIKTWLSENKEYSRILIPNMIYLNTSLGEFLIEAKLDFISGERFAEELSKEKQNSEPLCALIHEILDKPCFDFEKDSTYRETRDTLMTFAKEIEIADFGFFQGHNVGITFRDVNGVKEPFLVMFDFDTRIGESDKNIQKQIASFAET